MSNRKQIRRGFLRNHSPKSKEHASPKLRITVDEVNRSSSQPLASKEVHGREQKIRSLNHIHLGDVKDGEKISVAVRSPQRKPFSKLPTQSVIRRRSAETYITHVRNTKSFSEKPHTMRSIPRARSTKSRSTRMLSRGLRVNNSEDNKAKTSVIRILTPQQSTKTSERNSLPRRPAPRASTAPVHKTRAKSIKYDVLEESCDGSHATKIIDNLSADSSIKENRQTSKEDQPDCDTSNFIMGVDGTNDHEVNNISGNCDTTQGNTGACLKSIHRRVIGAGEQSKSHSYAEF